MKWKGIGLEQVHTELLSHSGREKFCSCAR